MPRPQVLGLRLTRLAGRECTRAWPQGCVTIVEPLREPPGSCLSCLHRGWPDTSAFRRTHPLALRSHAPHTVPVSFREVRCRWVLGRDDVRHGAGTPGSSRPGDCPAYGATKGD
jgi:hypothetical protein